MLPVARDFVGCRALTDILLEFLEWLGYCRNGYAEFGLSYMSVRQLFELGAPVICIAFMVVDYAGDDPLFQSYERFREILLSLVIFQYWYRMSQTYRCFQGFAYGILPVSLSLEYTIPALFLTSIIFIGLLQSLWVFVENKEEDQALYQHFYDTFGLLLTQDYPESNPKGDVMMLLALCFFTLIVVNFFIGVITEAYEAEKKQVELRLWSERATGCAAYFARARTIVEVPQQCMCKRREKKTAKAWDEYPSSGSLREDPPAPGCSKWAKFAWKAFQGAVLCSTIVYQAVLLSWARSGSRPGDWMSTKVVFFSAIFILHVTNFYYPGAPWNQQGCYLWIVKKRADIDESEDSDEEEAAIMRKIIREELDGKKFVSQPTKSTAGFGDSVDSLPSPDKRDRKVADTHSAKRELGSSVTSLY
jgi:hypothetical protein